MRRADIVLGLPASEKSSTLVNKLLRDRQALLIDADEAKILLPEYDNGRGAPRVHQESSDIAETLLQSGLESGMNVVIAVIGKNPERIVKMAQDIALAGYELNVHLVEIPEEEAASRCLSRLEKSGRFVDPAYVLTIGTGPEVTYTRIKQEVAIYGYSRWSNDVSEGSPPKLLELSNIGLVPDAS